VQRRLSATGAGPNHQLTQENAMLDQTTPPPKPSVADIVHACVMAGRSAQDILTMSREAHPAKPIDAIKAEIVGAFQAGVGKEAGAENLGKIGDAVARELDRLGTDAPKPTPKPTVGADWVIHRIARQTFDAVYARDGKELTGYSLIKEARPVIGQHPGHDLLLLWLAQKGLDSVFDEIGSARGIWPDCYPLLPSPEVEATQEDLDYDPPED
jgi:hypothetical protein